VGTELLMEAFENFKKASTSLEKVHEHLNARILELSQELEKKNKELEKSLAENERIKTFLNSILENLASGVIVLDREGFVHLANKAAEEFLVLFGIKEKNVPRVPYGLLRRFLGALNSRSGSIELNVSDRVILATGTPFFNGNEKLAIYVLQDITELRRLQKEHLIKTRLSSMGEMAIQLAHEIRNPLGGILLYLSLLKKNVKEGDEAAEWIENVETGVNTINYIVSNMLSFYKPLKLNVSLIPPAKVMERAIALVQSIASARNVNLVLEDRYATEVIRADGELLLQLGMNLLRNALNAMKEEGEIRVIVDGPSTGPQGGQVPYCCFSFEDNGVGMTEDEVRMLFEPFWGSQKGGHGIGMWVSKQIVQLHGGIIEVDSCPGQGTRINVWIPTFIEGENNEEKDSSR